MSILESVSYPEINFMALLAKINSRKFEGCDFLETQIIGIFIYCID